MADEIGLPEGWEIRMSNSKHQPYYFNPKSLESRWDPPEGADFEKLKDHMAKNYSSSILNPRANGNGAGGDKIRCAHVLVKHRDSRRPSSWRQAKITRSKEEARSILQRFQERINSGETTLGDLAVSESDCTSARKRGDLGYFAKGEMQKEFEDAAFVLKPGELSGIVESASGLHLIERLE